MSRWLLLLPLISACTTVGVVDEPNDPWADATLRIQQPASGSFLELEDSHEFLATLTAANGTELSTDGLDIEWTSSVESSWSRQGASFTDDSLDVGLHDITAEVVLPNGDRLAHTVGGILLQSRYAGTYSGLFDTQIGFQQAQANCSGTVTLIVDPYGRSSTGDATCVASLLGNSTQVHYTFDLTNASGALDGTAALDLFGFSGLQFPAQGTLDPDDGTLDVSFDGGPASQFIAISGTAQADRTSRDAGL